MRVLRLISPESFVVEFHPYVTVVTGLDPEQRTALLRAFEGVPRADAAGLGGLIEAHGVVLDFDEESLRLAGLGAVDIDVVVRSDDLPGSASAAVRRQLGAAVARLEGLEEVQERARAEGDAADADVAEAEAAVAAARRRIEAAAAPDAAERLAALDDEITTLETALAAASDVEATARAATADATAALDERGEALAEATAVVERAAAEAAAAEAVRAEAVAARFPDAMAELTAAQAALDALHTSGPDHVATVAADELAVVDHELAQLVALLDALTSFDPEPVRVALEIHLGGPADIALMPSAEALALAEQIDHLLRQVADAVPVDALSPGQIEQAEEAVAEAQSALFEAERLSRPDPLDPHDVAALDAAHHAVLEAQEKVDKRFGGSRAASRLTEARAAEHELLDRFGFPTWSDYVIGAGIRSTDPVLEERVTATRRALAAAENHLAELRHALALDLAAASAAEALWSARERAHALVGPNVADDELVDALQQLRVAETGRSPVGELRAALVDVGLAVDDDLMGSDELVAIAEAWLAEASIARRESADLVDRRAELVNRREDLQRRVTSSPAPVASDADAVAAAEAAVAGARLRLDADARGAVAEKDAASIVAEAAAVIDAADAARAEASEALTSAEDVLVAARFHHDAATTLAEAAAADLEAARAERDALAEVLAHGAAAGELESELLAAEDALMVAETERSRVHAQLSEASVAVRALVEEVAALRAALGDLEHALPPPDEVEWYLLARLAAQRQVSFAGSVPLLLDDAVPRVGEDDLGHVLDRLERMAGAVQVVHLTDHDGVVSWANEAGPDRVAVVRPVTARRAG